MGKREALITALGVGMLFLVCWLACCDGHVKLAAQLQAAAGSGDDSPVTIGTQITTGACPDKWQPHVPARAHLGRHRMYHHPARASPGITAHMADSWRYDPPSEGDL